MWRASSMSAKHDRASLELIPPATYREVRIERALNASREQASDYVAEERPVALLYQGVPHVVMLATPANLEDLAVGFTLSEGIVATADEIRAVECTSEDNALAVNVHIAAERFAAVLRRQRNMTARTGCGLCGSETIEDAIRTPAAVRSDLTFSAAELHEQLADLQAHQPLNRMTGSVHAAAWVRPGQGIQVVREDVGRHNALDKVIGALVREGVDCSLGYFLITSRASYEMIQKAASVGVSLVAAVSAPTAFAIDVATQTGLTLVGFARDSRHVVYTHAERLRD